MAKITKPIEQVELQQLNKKEIVLNIKGVTPLLMEKMNIDVVERYDGKKSKKITKKDDRAEKDKVEEKIYYTDEGNIGFPASAFAKGMVEVAPYLDSLDKKKVRGSVRVLGNIIPITFKTQKIHKTWGRTSGMSRAPRLILRPEFEEWSCELRILYNATNISAEQIINLVNWAGFQMGVGGFRPSCSGSYGQYEVVTK